MHLTVDIGKGAMTCFSLLGCGYCQGSGFRLARWFSHVGRSSAGSSCLVELDPWRHFYDDEKVCTLEEDRP